MKLFFRGDRGTPAVEKINRGNYWAAIFCMVLLCGCSADIAIKPPHEGPRSSSLKILPGDLKVLRMEMAPDPVREGEEIHFRMTVVNASHYSGKVSLFIRDRDELAAEAHDVSIRPGQNRIEFPWSGYRFSKPEHCFLVEADLERARRPIDSGKGFCAWRAQGGWTLSEARIGTFSVENLEIYPDPVYPREEVRFKVKLRNEGRPVRANIWIQDRNEIVAHMADLHIRHGYGEYQFPYSGYAFQKNEHCLDVVIDVEDTRQPVEAKRAFCARPLGGGLGWTLKP